MQSPHSPNPGGVEGRRSSTSIPPYVAEDEQNIDVDADTWTNHDYYWTHPLPIPRFA